MVDINEEQNKEQTPIDLTDEEKLIEIINERKFYRDRCSFYADVVSYMENVAGWHGKAPNGEQLAAAIEELGGDR